MADRRRAARKARGAARSVIPEAAMRSLAVVPPLLGVALLASHAAQAAPSTERPAAVIQAIKASRPAQDMRVLPTAAAVMPACDSSLQVKWLTNKGETRTVAVSCPQPSWRLYTTALIKTETTVLIARTSIKAGSRITKASVATETVPSSRIIGQPIKPSLLADGIDADSAIQPGQVLSQANTTIPVAIRAGSHVRLVAKTAAGLMISTQGIALQNGAIGQRIEVENAESHKRLHARVVDQPPVSSSGLFVVVSG